MLADVSLTVEGPALAFIATALLPIFGGKMLQQGGVKYARGEPYTFDTILGVMVLSAPLFIMIFIFFAAYAERSN